MVRKSNFALNDAKILIHNERNNEGCESFSVAHNQFSDYTQDELLDMFKSRQSILINTVEDERVKRNVGDPIPSHILSSTVSSSLDYREVAGMLGPVRNQG